jgi:hypothetical protein
MSVDATQPESIRESQTLYAKLAEIVAEVEGVAKSGKNTFHKYDYTTAEEMLRAIRGPLAQRKIALMPELINISERELKTAKGGVSIITTVRMSFTFMDGETGQEHTCGWAGQGDDPGDKGLAKAYTNAIKTFLREQFLIPQGDDPEADEKTDKRAAERVAAEPPTQIIPADRKMTPEEITIMVKAVTDTGQNLDLLLASVGVEAAVDCTVEQGRDIMRKLKA